MSPSVTRRTFRLVKTTRTKAYMGLEVASRYHRYCLSYPKPHIELGINRALSPVTIHYGNILFLTCTWACIRFLCLFNPFISCAPPDPPPPPPTHHTIPLECGWCGADNKCAPAPQSCDTFAAGCSGGKMHYLTATATDLTVYGNRFVSPGAGDVKMGSICGGAAGCATDPAEKKCACGCDALTSSGCGYCSS